MECDICLRGHDAKRLPFLCAVDARNQAYEGRFRHAELLIQNDELQREIGHLLADTATPNKEHQDSLLAQQRLAEDRTSHVLAAAVKLRAEIQAAKDEIRSRKAALARRKSDLASVSDGLAERRAKQQKDMERSTQMLKIRWSQNAQEMARTRSFLCIEAAKLYGLKRVRRGAAGQYEYHIGKIGVVDLTSMNSWTPEEISTSLSHISHILMLAAHYLAVRLPAAITLPHRDYPHPTILNLASSYKHRDIILPPQSGSSTPVSESRDSDSQHVSRSRPLFVDKPLPQLFKEDPATYSYFLEGVTLLSYDIAWLCSSQGVTVGNGFEDVCNIGHNLYSLLINQQPSVGGLLTKTNNRKIDDESDEAQSRWMGRYSHGTTYYFLGSAEGAEIVRNFKLLGPMKLADKLKKILVSDAPAPDWEVLEDDAWRVDDGTDDVQGSNKSEEQKKTMDARASSRNGSNGWMKLKNR